MIVLEFLLVAALIAVVLYFGRLIERKAASHQAILAEKSDFECILDILTRRNLIFNVTYNVDKVSHKIESYTIAVEDHMQPTTAEKIHFSFDANKQLKWVY